MSIEQEFPDISPFATALRCSCPRCGAGKLFHGMLTVVASCSNCGLELEGQDSADGPAVFGILIVGALAVCLMAVLEFTVRPPIWVHIAAQVPVVIGASLVSLRFFKALMIALQYHNRIGGFEED